MAEEKWKSESILLEEYKTLRSEILQRLQTTNNLMTFSIMATGALLGYGMNVKEGFIFLIPFSILIPMSYATKKEADIILFLGTYISVMIEKHMNGLQWETFRYKFREYKSKVEKWPRMIESMIIYDSLVLSCFAMSIIYWKNSLILFIAAILPLILYFVWWNYSMSQSYSFDRQKRYLQEIERTAKRLMT
jgi:uncharacterized membrane protein